MLLDEEGGETADGMLVPLNMGEHTVYLAVRGLEGAGAGEESEISGREPRLDQVLDGLTEFSKELMGRLHQAGASKVTVEFGCEIAVDSGSLFAVIGKASAKSTLKVGLEWTKPAP